MSDAQTWTALGISAGMLGLLITLVLTVVTSKITGMGERIDARLDGMQRQLGSLDGELHRVVVHVFGGGGQQP